MKKLMIAAAIVCAAVATQAATFNWKTNARGGAVVAPDGKTLTSATAYIFESRAAANIVQNWAEGNDWTVGNYDNNTMSAAGAITTKSEGFEFGDKGAAATMTAVFAFTETIGGQEYLYVSTEATKAGTATGTQTIQFTEGGTTVFDAAKGFQGAGWYTKAAPVPEPTSGLLLLLGVAGMALRRRRA